MTMRDPYMIKPERIRGGVSVTPPGSNTQIIYNNSGALGASSKLAFNEFAGEVQLTSINLSLNGGYRIELYDHGDIRWHNVGNTASAKIEINGSTVGDVEVTLPPNGGTILVAIGEVASTGTPIYSAAVPLYFKDTQGTPHYWSAYLSNVGALVTTDLGTTQP